MTKLSGVSDLTFHNDRSELRLESWSTVKSDDKYCTAVSRESNLRSVPYNRPVGVRSFVKNVNSLSENQHNS